MDILTNLIFGIIASLIAAVIFETLRNNSNWFPGVQESQNEEEPELQNIDDQRAQNRAKLNLALFNIFFYAYTFFIIYIALLMPPMLKTLFNKNTIYLSDARFIGHLLPQIEIGSNIVQSTFIGIAAIIYIPTLFIVDGLTPPISCVIDNFFPITSRRKRGIQGLIFALCAACIAILSIYLFQ